MDTDNTNEKLQTRREFFKKAAKSVLPILGAIAFSHVPTILKAEPKIQMGCNGDCEGGCDDSCYNSCRGYCIEHVVIMDFARS